MTTKPNAVLETLWAKVKPLLLPYEGSVSQIYVLDLPISALEKTISEFCKKAECPVISTLGGYTFGDDKAPMCDATSHIQILSDYELGLHSIISGRLFNGKNFSLWTWPNYKKKSFDAELVFWADELFPPEMEETDYINSFGSVHLLVEIIREMHPNSACVFSSRPVGDPRKDKNKPHTIYW